MCTSPLKSMHFKAVPIDEGRNRNRLCLDVVSMSWPIARREGTMRLWRWLHLHPLQSSIADRAFWNGHAPDRKPPTSSWSSWRPSSLPALLLHRNGVRPEYISLKPSARRCIRQVANCEKCERTLSTCHPMAGRRSIDGCISNRSAWRLPFPSLFQRFLMRDLPPLLCCLPLLRTCECHSTIYVCFSFLSLICPFIRSLSYLQDGGSTGPRAEAS